MHAYSGPSPGHLATICHYQLLSRAEHVRRSLPLSIFVISHLHINMNIYNYILCIYILKNKNKNMQTHIYIYFLLYIYIYLSVCVSVCVCVFHQIGCSFMATAKLLAQFAMASPGWKHGGMTCAGASSKALASATAAHLETGKRKQLKMKFAKIVHECGTGAYRRNHTK